MSKTLMCFAAVSALIVAAPAMAAPDSATSAPDSAAAAAPAMSAGSTATGAAAKVGAPPAPSTSAAESAGNDAVDTTAAPAAATASARAGLAVKDNTGATIGEITDVKAGADGAQTATIKMGDKTFSVATTSLGLTADAATINMTKVEIEAMVKSKS